TSHSAPLACSLVVKEMSRRRVERALKTNGCEVLSDDGSTPNGVARAASTPPPSHVTGTSPRVSSATPSTCSHVCRRGGCSDGLHRTSQAVGARLGTTHRRRRRHPVPQPRRRSGHGSVVHRHDDRG